MNWRALHSFISSFHTQFCLFLAAPPQSTMVLLGHGQGAREENHTRGDEGNYLSLSLAVLHSQLWCLPISDRALALSLCQHFTTWTISLSRQTPLPGQMIVWDGDGWHQAGLSGAAQGRAVRSGWVDRDQNQVREALGGIQESGRCWKLMSW